VALTGPIKYHYVEFTIEDALTVRDKNSILALIQRSPTNRKSESRPEKQKCKQNKINKSYEKEEKKTKLTEFINKK
jgi:hypothetical protein